MRAETHLAKFLAQLQHSLPVLSPTGPAVNFYLTKIVNLVLYLVIKKIVSFFFLIRHSTMFHNNWSKNLGKTVDICKGILLITV